ncbi:MAG TPA: T9SS type A sorting domain-containing protein [Bacteroidetes bacterium]|nr:T9SS type A sorting domain-containing protein [Bacteroidota bacterium]
MKIKITSVFAFFFFFASQMQAQVNYSEDIAPIIYNNCTVCHRAGEIGPMPLTNYEEVKVWGSMIEYVTSIKYMPPWPADREFSTFVSEAGLTDGEIQLISDWVAAGTPQGDPALEPPLPSFPTGSQVGEPDLVLSFERPYVHEGDLTDQYQIIVLPTGLTEDKYVKAIEMRPGNKAIVHHALFAVDDTGEGQVLDAQTPEYGFPSFGDFGVETAVQIPQGYVPGATPTKFYRGIGSSLPAGSDILVQMHYAPIPVTESDSSTVNIFFADPDETIEREVKQHIMLPFFGTLTNGPFFMPAESVKTFHGVYTVPEKVSLIGIFPHSHLLGKDWKVIAVAPNGDTTNLISIPEWDFNWQRTYFFKKFQVLEPGTKIHAYATYDNTSSNPYNPNNPPQAITWGLGTEDEMYYLPLVYVDYFPGDEDIELTDDPVSSAEDLGLKFPADKLYPVYPNPSNNKITVGFTLARAEKVALEVLDLQGRLVKTILENDFRHAGPNQMRVELGSLPGGVYLLNLKSERFSMAEKFYINR